MGDVQKSDASLGELMKKHGETQPYFIAWPLAILGKSDLAFECLEKSVGVSGNGLYGLLTNPAFSNLYNDPRWLPFLEKIGRSPEQLDSIEFDIVLPE